MEQRLIALGKSIKKAMVDADLTLPQTARAAGISASTLRRKLSGAGAPLDVIELHGLSRALDVPMAKLLPPELANASVRELRRSRKAS